MDGAEGVNDPGAPAERPGGGPDRPARPVALEARDGFPLAATFFEPAADPPSAVLLAPAMGVRRSFYAAFGQWMAGRGPAVLTLDYRGTGGSRPDRLREMEGDLYDVGRCDLPAALDWLERRFPGTPLGLVAHSVGGQLVGLLPRPGRLSRILAVAAATGHWRFWPRPDRWRVAALWWVLIPVLTRVLGRFPGRVAGIGEDLSPGIARSWARWGRHRDYLVDREGRPLRSGFRGFGGALRAYSFPDDPLAPRRAVEELLGWYSAADVEHRRVAPSDVGQESIGHMGFFRERCREPLWREAAGFLAAGEAG